MKTNLHFKNHGLDCADEVAVLKREVGPLVGGQDNLSFDILKGRMSVRGGDAEQVIEAVARTGMKAELWREDGEPSVPSGFWQRRGRMVLTTLSGLAVLVGIVTDATPVYAFAIIAGAWYILPKAWFALKRLRPDMNLLMTIAVIGAAAIGQWFEAATVSFLFAVSLTLESWSVGRARRAVEALMDLAAPLVRLRLPDGSEQEVPAEEAPPGSAFLVKSGEKIALDGRIVSGWSEINQAPITGESVPAPKQAGDEVFAGTINGDGALVVESTKAAGDTTLAHIIRMVAEAQSRRAPSEQWVERFAAVYTPAVIALALAVLVIPPVVFAQPWPDWIYRSLVLLVIGCPCALVISTPVSIVAALTAAASNGVLVKGGVYLEEPAKLKALALDKTGTLTAGRPAVVEVDPLNGHTETELLGRASAMETHSNHPLASAIVDHAAGRGITSAPAGNFQNLPGKGATAILDGRNYWLGSHRYLEERGQETQQVHDRQNQLSSAGRTVVIIGNDDHVCGLIALSDTLRPAARELVDSLHRAGIEHIAMLTGDNEGTAQAIASEAGIDEVHAELLPQDKVTVVEQLVEHHRHVAMVGDGVNDAPAMARASLGIAMGAVGSDAAIEAADIALMSDDLAKLPWLLRHSRRTLRIIRENITLSIAIKVLFVALTFIGYASLWTAIAADMGVSLLVIFNALRLLKTR